MNFILHYLPTDVVILVFLFNFVIPEFYVFLTLPRKDGILLGFLNYHLENPEHHPIVMGCDTPKDISLSNIQQKTNPLIARPLSEKS